MLLATAGPSVLGAPLTGNTDLAVATSPTGLLCGTSRRVSSACAAPARPSLARAGILDPPPGASVNPTTSVTDSLGIATTTWTLGNALGVQTAQAMLPAAQSPLVMFTATATPRP